MQRLEREGVVQRDALSFIETVDGSGELVAVQLQGRPFCPEREVAIRVAKRMEVRRGAANRYEVRTVSYAYHAWVRRRGPGAARRNLLRIDTNGHRPGLHAHLFDGEGNEVQVTELAIEDLPTLDAFIRHVATAK